MQAAPSTTQNPPAQLSSILVDSFFINLAIIKINWDNNTTSLIDNFMPIVGRAIQLLTNEEISELELKEKITEFSGFRIPSGALSVLIRRASKSRNSYVTRKDNIFVKNHAVVDRIDFDSSRRVIESDIVDIKIAFGNFAAKYESQIASPVRFEDSFIEVLSEMAPNIIDSAALRREFDNHYQPDTFHYIVSNFIISASNENKRIFDKIVNIAQGAILAEMLYYTDESLVQKKMKNVKVFFDTRFLIYTLGYCDDHEKFAVDELLVMLRALDAKLRTFDTTLSELKGVLSAASHHARRGWRGASYSPGDLFDFLSRRSATPSDIELIISRLEEKLREKDILVERVPDIDHSIHIDSAKLDQYILQEVQYLRQPTRDHDIRVLTAINQLRGGIKKKFFEDCVAIFVTTNAAIARASVRFFNEEIGVSDAPVCIPSHVFTMLMWLKSVNKKPKLPTEILITNAMAAMLPSDSLWIQYMEEIRRQRSSKTITEDDYTFLARALESPVNNPIFTLEVV